MQKYEIYIKTFLKITRFKINKQLFLTLYSIHVMYL